MADPIFSRSRFTRLNVFPVMFAQAAYYLITGVWPLVSIASFTAITGPKTDLWLVKVVGVLVAIIGASILLAALRHRAAAETIVLALGTAVLLIVLEVIYVIDGTLSPIYLLDALLQIAFVAAWGYVLYRDDLLRRGADTSI